MSIFISFSLNQPASTAIFPDCFTNVEIKPICTIWIKILTNSWEIYPNVLLKQNWINFFPYYTFIYLIIEIPNAIFLINPVNLIPEFLLRRRPFFFRCFHESAIPVLFNHISILSLILENIDAQALLVVLALFLIIQSIGPIFLILVVTLNVEPVFGDIDEGYVGNVSCILCYTEHSWNDARQNDESLHFL